MNSWYKLPTEELYAVLDSSPHGLTKEEAARRLLRDGKNELPRPPKPSIFLLIIQQIIAPFSILLIIAAGISYFLKEYTDAVAILAAVLLNVVLTTYFQRRTHTLTEKLRVLRPNQVRVRREGVVAVVPAAHLVTGDIILLEAGQRVPADCRLLKVNVLRIDESVLTGESLPQTKVAEPILHDVNIQDQKNSAFLGTLVTHGKAEAIVTAIGSGTAVGAIEQLTERAAAPPSPLQDQVKIYSRWLTWLAFVAAFLYFGIVMFSDKEQLHGLQGAAALGVSVVPEGLPVIITLGLLVGVYRLAQKNALVKNMAALDSMAYVSSLITDKTGTITENNLKVSAIYLPSADGYTASTPQDINPFANGLSALLLTGVLANEAAIEPGGEELHDPLERALLEVAKDLNVDTGRVIKMHKPVLIVPFSSEKKYMAVAYRHSIKEVIWHIKGAPDVLMKHSSHIYRSSHNQKWDHGDKQQLEKILVEAGEKAQKTIGCATRVTSNELLERIKKSPDTASTLLLDDLLFLGTVGLHDSLRSDAAETIKALQDLDIEVKIATGDHPSTARAIAQAVHIPSSMVAPEGVSQLNPKSVHEHAIFARVQPVDKLTIIKALQKRGATVAMIGDGINDVPSLKQADIGISVGKGATDAAHDIADIILLDSSLKTILIAIQYGRNLMQNLRLIILFFIATSLLEVTAILLTTLLTKGEPALLPTQILWLNLLTDTLLALPLLYEVQTREATAAKERGRRHFFSEGQLKITIISASALLISSLILFFTLYIPSVPSSTTLSQTAFFHAICFGEIGVILTLRQPHRHFVHYWRENSALIATIALVIFVQLFALLLPPLRSVLHLSSLNQSQLLLVLAASCSGFLVGELYKLLRKRPKA